MECAGSGVLEGRHAGGGGGGGGNKDKKMECPIATKLKRNGAVFHCFYKFLPCAHENFHAYFMHYLFLCTGAEQVFYCYLTCSLSLHHVHSLYSYVLFIYLFITIII